MRSTLRFFTIAASVGLLVLFVTICRKRHPIEPEYADGSPLTESSDSTGAVLATERSRKFIGATFSICSGLGNQMFRTASLYALGQSLDRAPFLNATLPCTAAWVREFQTLFPHTTSHLHRASPEASLVRRVQFGDGCCQADDPLRLLGFSEPFLVLSGNYLQSIKYFETRKEEIRRLFDFHPFIQKEVQQAAQKLFADDHFHKMCVHIRRGDFVSHQELLESRAEFVQPAIDVVRVELRQRGIQNASLVLLGRDTNFIQKLDFSRASFHAVYRTTMTSRGSDMAFGARHCHSLLISASASTFAFWTGFLMPEDAPIFYNQQSTKIRARNANSRSADYFPARWIPLSQDLFTFNVSLGLKL